MALESMQNYIIGVILFVIVISGGVFILGNFYAVDNSIDASNRVGSFNNTLNKASEVTLAVEGIDSSIEQNNTSPLGWVDVVFGSAYNGLRAVKSSMGFMGVATKEAGGLFGVPPFITVLLALIFVVIIAFAIWSAVTRSP